MLYDLIRGMRVRRSAFANSVFFLSELPLNKFKKRKTIYQIWRKRRGLTSPALDSFLPLPAAELAEQLAALPLRAARGGPRGTALPGCSVLSSFAVLKASGGGPLLSFS